MYTGEADENSRYSSPERDKTENFDTDNIQRHVHFKQNDDSAKEENVDHGPKRTVHENAVRKVEETYLTELPQTTKPKSSEDKQHAKRLSNSSRENNQKSHNEGRRISSELPTKDQILQDNQLYPNAMNGVTSDVPSSDNKSDNRDTKQITSSIEEQHSKSPR